MRIRHPGRDCRGPEAKEGSDARPHTLCLDSGIPCRNDEPLAARGILMTAIMTQTHRRCGAYAHRILRRDPEARDPRQRPVRPGPVPALRHPQRLLHGARPCGARPAVAALGQHHHGLSRAGRQDSLLPVGGVPDGPAARQQPPEPGDRRRGARGGERPRPRSGRVARARGGARAGQWRAGAPRRVFHGLPRHAGDARHRLRHPLRVRHLRPGHPRRLAGGGDGQVAAARQSLGDRQARAGALRRLRRPLPSAITTIRAATGCAGSPSAR